MPPIILLGNKKDLIDMNPDARKVSSQDVNDLIAECDKVVNRTAQSSASVDSIWSILHYETSALTGEKIDTIFDNMVREIRARQRPASKDKKKKDSWCFLL
jgi:hypothetical protein